GMVWGVAWHGTVSYYQDVAQEGPAQELFSRRLITSNMNDGKPDMVFADAELVKRYVSFRMSPPQNLILKVVDFLKEKGDRLEQSVDVGCGSGQSTAPYSPFFSRVTGIDVSADQLEHAQQDNKLQNVSFREGQAESIPFADSSVDLVTVCAAVHWFDHDKFYKEVDRVLRPGGVLAVYSYLGTDPIYNGNSFKHLVMQAWEELDQYVGHQHHHLKTEYSTLKSCYPEDVHIG
ncbi:unnamed protein product, partial [Meganyctiphanes norvegica]